jgi:hypothetical protein
MRKLRWLLFFGLALAAAHATTGARAETSIGADDGKGFGMLCPQPQQMVIGISVLLEFEPGYGDAIKNLGILCTSRDDAWNWAGGTEERQKRSSPDLNKPAGPWMMCPQNTFISAIGVMRWVNAANQRVFAGLQLVCTHPGQQPVTVNPDFITNGTHAPSNFGSTELRCLPNGMEQASFLSGIHGRYAAGQAQFGDAAVTKLGIYCLADAPSVGGGVAAVDPQVIDTGILQTLPQGGAAVITKPQGQDFINPEINGNGVDFCLNWATNCGKPAADAFCRSHGFAESGGFTYLENRPPTFVIGDLKICNQPGCTRFTQIYCAAGSTQQAAAAAVPAPAPAGNQFTNPKGPNGLALYACTSVGSGNCGAAVAAQFCQRQGFAGAQQFSFDNKKLRAETLAGQVCSKKRCQVFEFINCRN